MSEPALPLGATTPDELLVMSLDPGLTDAERAEVEAWLAAHPEWRPRAQAYDTLAVATRRSVSTDVRPPDIGAMAGLWAAIDAEPPPSQASPAPFAPPPAPVSLDAHRARRRPGGWLMAAAAAALLVVAAGVVVVASGGDDGAGDTAAEVEPTPTTGLEPGGTVPPAPAVVPDTASLGSVPGDDSPDTDQLALTRVREGVDRTKEMQTADVVYRSIGTADVSDSELGDLTGEDVVSFETVGRGQLAFPDRSILTTRTVTRVGERTDVVPDDLAVTVTDGDRRWVRCGGEPDFVETDDMSTTGCMANDVDPTSFSPEMTLEVVGQESFAQGGLLELGADTLDDGTPITGYQATQPFPIDGEMVDVTVQIWLDDQGFVRRLVSGASFSGAEGGYPIDLVMSYELFNLGTEVEIPELD